MRQAERDKRDRLIRYAKCFELKNFVETGTYKGDTVKAMLVSGLFEAIHTIDIYVDWVARSERRFASHLNVECWCGDSATQMPDIVGTLVGPTLFWLDAHHSGKQIARVNGLIETPIIAELNAILGRDPGDVILIDDAHYYEEFAAKYPNYPSMEVLKELVRKKCPNWVFEIKNDVIRVHRDTHNKTSG